MKASVHVIPALSDNFAYVVESPEAVIVIDPGEARPVLALLDDLGRTPSHVLITHHEYDHIGGIPDLKSRYDVEVISPELSDACADGETIEVGSLAFRVINTPGHYDPHVSFYEPEHGWLFAGDCIFGAGCGRVRGGAYRELFESIRKLASLPDETRIYFGHEYTLDNLAFAASVESDNAAIRERRKRAAAALKRGESSSPSTLADEKATNPFLRAASVDEFTQLRQAKDRF